MRTLTYRYVWNPGGSCKEDIDCGIDKSAIRDVRCINDKCVQLGIHCDDYSGDNNHCQWQDHCVNNICIPRCKNNQDCPDGEFCARRQARLCLNSEGSCKKDFDCGTDRWHKCINDKCVQTCEDKFGITSCEHFWGHGHEYEDHCVNNICQPQTSFSKGSCSSNWPHTLLSLMFFIILYPPWFSWKSR